MTSLTNSNLELKNMFGQFMKMNTASSSGSGTPAGNTITNPKEELKGITTRSGTTYQGPTIPTTSSSLPLVVEHETEATKDTVHPTNNGSTKDVQPLVVQGKSLILNYEPIVAPIIEPVDAPVSGTFKKRRPEECYDLIKNMIAHYNDWDTSAQRTTVGQTKNVYAAEAYQGNTITNPKEELKGITTRSGTAYQGPTIPTTSSSLPLVVEHETEATKDTVHPTNNGSSKSSILNYEPIVAPIIEPVDAPTLLTNKDKLSELARTSLNEHCPAVLLKKLPEKLEDPDKFLIPCDFPRMAECLAVVDLEVEAFLALEDDPTLLKGDQSYVDTKGDILLLDAFLNDDPSLSPPNQENYLPQVRKELKSCEAKTNKSSIDEPPEEKATLITVLKSHKRAIAWKLSYIKGIDSEFCTHKILMEEDFEPAIQHQRRVNPKIHDVIKNEVLKLLDAGLIYPISYIHW
nr:reverse transcriptase domain-containing protein [Tanacetum cinerariifolium]